jgi:hypothetical protein
MFWIIQTMIRRHESKMAGYAFGSNPPYPRFLKAIEDFNKRKKQFVLALTLFRSQRTNRSRAHQGGTILKNWFALWNIALSSPLASSRYRSCETASVRVTILGAVSAACRSLATSVPPRMSCAKESKISFIPLRPDFNVATFYRRELCLLHHTNGRRRRIMRKTILGVLGVTLIVASTANAATAAKHIARHHKTYASKGAPSVLWPKDQNPFGTANPWPSGIQPDDWRQSVNIRWTLPHNLRSGPGISGI